MSIRKHVISLSAVLLGAIGLAPVANASVVGITGVVTSVEVTSFDTLTTGLGLDVGLLGSASIDLGGTFPVVSFPITGGTFDTVTGLALIEHDGSGLSLSTDSDTVELENFLIDTGNGLLSGLVSVNGSEVGTLDLFNISPSLQLLLTDGAADALNGVFQTELVGGIEFGVASVDLTTIPVPAALPLLLTALGGLGFLRRRRAA